MAFPDFHDFLASLDRESIEAIFTDAKDKAESVVVPGTPALGNQVTAISFTIALELLASYHAWISKELH